jgi:signal transduction histidine kinase
MRTQIGLLLFLLPCLLLAKETENLESLLLNLEKFEFNEARRNALVEKDHRIRFEMLKLVDILYYEGQIDSTTFKVSDEKFTNSAPNVLIWLQSLNGGYLSLFYKGAKGDAYKKMHRAYQLAQEFQNPALIKASLFAFFKYYNYELIYKSDSFEPHLKHFETLNKEKIDELWLTIYQLIFYSKKPYPFSKETDQEYYKLSERLDEYESSLDTKSPVLAYVFYEKAVKYTIEKDFDNCSKYFNKVITQASGFPFLRYQRFNSCLRLLDLESKRKRFSLARVYYEMARKEINVNDTLRSNADLNMYASFFYGAIDRYDSAYLFLKKAYTEDAMLNYKTNLIEINRLNVELQTQEKENSNLQLRQNRNWLLSALGGVALLLVASYFAYANQRTKNEIQAQEKKVQAMKLEKVLKDQEIFGIDAMLEGQEKERLRMASDLHDNLGGLLAAVKLHLQSLTSKKNFMGSDHALNRTEALLEEAYQQVRGMAHAGNAGVNAQEGLLPAIKNFATKVSILNRLTIDVQEHGMNSRLENSLEISIFRITQELITNVIKHAHANAAVIHLTQYEDTINLMVEDNGVGFDISQIKPSAGMGLHSIQRKIENLGGRVTIDSIAQKGTTVIIDIPLT